MPFWLKLERGNTVGCGCIARLRNPEEMEQIRTSSKSSAVNINSVVPSVSKDSIVSDASENVLLGGTTVPPLSGVVQRRGEAVAADSSGSAPSKVASAAAGLVTGFDL